MRGATLLRLLPAIGAGAFIGARKASAPSPTCPSGHWLRAAITLCAWGSAAATDFSLKKSKACFRSRVCGAGGAGGVGKRDGQVCVSQALSQSRLLSMRPPWFAILGSQAVGHRGNH